MPRRSSPLSPPSFLFSPPTPFLPPHAEVRTIFQAVDTDKSGVIDAIELQNALVKGGFQLSLTSAAVLIRLHDSDGDGKVNFNEFFGLHKFLAQVQQAYVNASGSPTATQIHSGQVKNALDALGYNWIDPPAFTAMCVAFDPNRDQMFGLTEFIAMVAFLKTVLGTFKGFDSGGRGVVTLSLNQFLYAASNTR